MVIRPSATDEQSRDVPLVDPGSQLALRIDARRTRHREVGDEKRDASWSVHSRTAGEQASWGANEIGFWVCGSQP